MRGSGHPLKRDLAFSVPRPSTPDNVRDDAGNASLGIAFMVGATLLFCLADTLMKLAAGVLPTTETMFVRSLVATVVVASAAAARGHLAHWRHVLTGAMSLRAAADSAASLLFQSALSRMQFADIMGVNQLQTLSLTAGSALFLGESVGWRRWSAVGVGLLGGLLIIKPGTSAFNWWALAALGAVLMATTREIATRKIANAAPVPVIMVFSSGVVTLVSLAGSLVQSWSTPGLPELLMMIGAGFFSLGGQYCMISSIRTAPISVVAPFRYLAMIWALLLGFGIWRHVPDALSLVGIAAIAAAGIYTFRRERYLQIRRESGVG